MYSTRTEYPLLFSSVTLIHCLSFFDRDYFGEKIGIYFAWLGKNFVFVDLVSVAVKCLIFFLRVLLHERCISYVSCSSFTLV